MTEPRYTVATLRRMIREAQARESDEQEGLQQYLADEGIESVYQTMWGGLEIPTILWTHPSGISVRVHWYQDAIGIHVADTAWESSHEFFGSVEHTMSVVNEGVATVRAPRQA